MSIDKFSCLLETQWTLLNCRPNHSGRVCIEGHWAEDGSRYTIWVPEQLASTIIELQNCLYTHHADTETTNRKLSRLNSAFKEIFK